MSARQITLYKVTATGNDFLLVDLLDTRSRSSTQSQRRKLVRAWCDRHMGIGADGVAFLEKSKVANFAWDFYNSDGSSAEMCGNAARAVSLFYFQRRQQKKRKTTQKEKITFQTQAGIVESQVTSAKRIEVSLPPIKVAEWNQPIQWKGAQWSFDFIRAGVPHAVVKVPSFAENQSLVDFALELKRQPRFKKEGVNVTFVHPLSKRKLASKTFERGVEGFTLSCGTGAIAAAFSVLQGEENQAIEVQVPGGQLFVVWKKGRPFLTGPASVVARIQWLWP